MKRATLLLAIFAHSHVLALPTLCEIKKFFGFSNYGASVYINDRDAKRFLAKLQAGEPLPFDDPDVYDYLQNLYAQEYGINLAELIQETLGLQDVTQVQFIPLSAINDDLDPVLRKEVENQVSEYEKYSKVIQTNMALSGILVVAGVLIALIPHPVAYGVAGYLVGEGIVDLVRKSGDMGELNEKRGELYE